MLAKVTTYKILTLAPILKTTAGPTGKSGASLSGKSGGKSTFGSTISKTSTNSFGSPSKSSSSKVTNKTPIFGASKPKPSSGLIASTSKKTYEYEHASFAPKSGKTTFGIVWIPTKKKNKKKDLVYSSINYDKNERSPSMYDYKFMSGDSSEQVHKKKDEEASLLVPERLKGPIATVASAGTAATIPEVSLETSSLEDKLLKRDNDDSKEAAGDAYGKEDDYLENKDTLANSLDKKKENSANAADKVDSVYVPQTAIKVPPRSTASTPEEEDCGIKCLYYTLHCCDCVLM